MGIVRAYQKGTLKGKATPEVQGAASSMKKKDVKKFASTKHKGLPEKKVTKESVNEDAKMAKQSDDKLKAAHTKFSGMDKSPANTFMLKRIQREMNKRKKKVVKEDYVKELEDGLVKMDYPTYMEVDELMKKIAKENDIDTTTLHMAFKTKHLMVPDDWAKKKMMEPVMIPKTPKITGDVKEGVTAKQRFKRDAGAIAKKKIKQKEHNKYVNFLDVDEAVNAAQQAAIAISKRERLQDLKVAKKRKLKKEDYEPVISEKCWKGYEKKGMKTMFGKRYPNCVKKKGTRKEEYEPINELSQDTLNQAARQAMSKREAARGTPEFNKRQKQVEKFTNAASKKRKEIISKKDTLQKSFDKPDAQRTPTMEANLYEYDGNYHMNKIAKEKGLDLTDPRQRRRANSLARHNAAKGNVNNPAGFSKRKKKKKIQTEGNLHKWFKGSKSKDGKGGWVNVVTGGTCASDEPGEGTPKCVSSSKRASMTKAERLSASRRKKKADPNQQSKSGAAKPTYVSTDKKKVKKESYIPEEGYDHIKDRIAMAGGNPGSKKKKDATTIKKDFKDYKRERKGDTNYQKEMRKKYGGRLPSALELVKAKQIEKYGKGAIMDEYINELETKTMLNYIDKASDSASNQINKAKKFESKGKLKKAAKARLKMEKRESGIAMAKDKILKRQEDKTLTSLKRSYDGPDAVREEKKVMGKIKKSFRRDEFGDPIKLDGSYAGKPNPDKNPKDEKITHSNSYQPDMSMVEAKDLTGNFDKGKKPIKVNLKDLVNKAKNNPKNKNLGVKPPTDTEDVTEAKSAAWQRKAGKSESGGLNAKGVASYRAANPGSKLKTAVTTKPSKLKKGSKSAKRRLSFCRRMRGMKKKLTSAKTARDPDSRINKSLRKWNCSFEPETGEMIMERGPQVLGSGARQKSIHAKTGKKGTKKVSGMIKSLKRKGSILKQPLGGPADAAAKARRLSYVKDDVDLTILRFIDEGHMNKTCGKGEYYCYQSKKCKDIPKGMKIGYGGMLKPIENEKDESNGKKGGSNGNGNGHGGNGNGNGGNGNGGNGGGNGGGE